MRRMQCPALCRSAKVACVLLSEDRRTQVAQVRHPRALAGRVSPLSPCMFCRSVYPHHGACVKKAAQPSVEPGDEYGRCEIGRSACLILLQEFNYVVDRMVDSLTRQKRDVESRSIFVSGANLGRVEPLTVKYYLVSISLHVIWSQESSLAQLDE